MNDARITLGKTGELAAISFLQRHGLKIIEQNYKCRYGEIDIIAKDKDIIAFVEVKTRKNLSCGIPQMAVDLRKQRQMSKVASHYIRCRRAVNIPARFDVIAINLADGPAKIEYIKDAFEMCL
ncbi:MAG: YraN family protein [Deltaproteobacteria bacterium]|nr:YraN family protein [Deltaproteobacteria bacterium]